MPPEKPLPSLHRSTLTDKDFKRFSEFIYNEVGIKLPPAKKTMIEARLQKRLRILNFPNHSVYVDYLFSPRGMEEELRNLIDVVTTNTTDFFREPQHFNILKATILPQWMARHGRHKRLSLWSAGCSTGMEPYTLAIVLNEFALANEGFGFSLLATDISTDALGTAVRAVYSEERIKPVPAEMKRKYFMRSKDRSKRLVRVVPELRRMVEFKRLNFMEHFEFRQPKDIIFCRNVVIYFDKPTQERLFTKFCRNLVQGGHLFIGHSESLAGMELPLKQIMPTVYQRL